MKTHLTSLAPDALEAWFRERGERPYRARQVFAWIHGRQAVRFDGMTDLQQPLREALDRDAVIADLNVRQVSEAADGSARKYLHALSDGKTIETVCIRHDNRRTVCVSSQVGCALGCTFCATARMGFVRNLSPGEIAEQVYSVMRDTGERITNVVFMGMGEPMLNYENVIAAAELLSHPHGLAIGARHINISTAGHVPGIRRYTKDGHPYRLAISLNDPLDASRETIMPINRKYPIAALLAAARDYTKAANKRVTFEYVLIAGVTDSVEKADALARLVQPVHCKINLIPYNPIDESHNRPSKESVERFCHALRHCRRQVNVRWSRGTDIQAACGQLVTGVEAA